MRIFARSGVTLHIGRAGENFTTEVAFDITSWVEEFGGDGNLCLTIEQPGEDLYCYMAPEPPEHITHVEVIHAGGDTYLLWKVDDHDTSHTYMGKCQLQYTIDGRVVKSAIYDIIVTNSLGDGQDEPPEAYTSWLEDLVEYVGYIRDNIEGIHAVSDNAEALVYGTQGGHYDKTTGKWVEGTVIPSMAKDNARYYSQYIETQKNVATQAAADAKNYRDAASSSATAAAGSASAASNSASAARTSELNAKASENAAKASENAAKASENAAATSATNASNSETNAANSASAAAASEAAAKASENAAKGSADAAKASQDAAKASEDAAKDSEDAAEDHMLDAEAWAVGEKNGTPVPTTAPQHENNSKYWSEQSSENGEAWAVGERGGAPVPSTDPAFENNAKYYAEQAGENAEAWATGERGGTPVSPTDPSYHNSAKYWADKAGEVVTSGGVATFNGRNGHVVPEASDYPQRMFHLTIQVSDWQGPVGEDGHYEATISDARLHADNMVYLVCPATASMQDYMDSEVGANDVVTDGQITFQAGVLPEDPLTVDLVEIYVQEV